MTQEEIITFLKCNKHLKTWWEANEKNYTMDVPMMFVGRIKELLAITEQSRQAAVIGSCAHSWYKSQSKGMLYCGKCGKYKPEGL